MIFENIQCDNCGALMIWNYVKGRYECKLCGAAKLIKSQDPLNRFPNFH